MGKMIGFVCASGDCQACDGTFAASFLRSAGAEPLPCQHGCHDVDGAAEQPPPATVGDGGRRSS